tara:strand:+ start:397 stop:711 length:315 start_codon:yes stop_codon:yes gene_type:complete
MTNYKFDDLCGMEPVPVIITEGKYEGISYSYGTIKFDDDDGEMKLNFDYDIVENPSSFDVDELDSNDEFHNIMGDILIDIIGKELAENEKDFLRNSSEKVNENG